MPPRNDLQFIAAETASLPEHTFEPLPRLSPGWPGPSAASGIIGDTWDLPKELVGEGTLFRLRVRGDSMINAAIADGDMVVMRQQSHVQSGDIVAAMLDGETTVKTFQRVDGQVWLIPHNPA
jgi:repressor LexA